MKNICIRSSIDIHAPIEKVYDLVTHYKTWEKYFFGTVILRGPIGDGEPGPLKAGDIYIEKILNALLTYFVIYWVVIKAERPNKMEIDGKIIWSNEIYQLFFGWMHIKLYWEYDLESISPDVTRWKRSFTLKPRNNFCYFMLKYVFGWYVLRKVQKEADLYQVLVRNEIESNGQSL